MRGDFEVLFRFCLAVHGGVAYGSTQLEGSPGFVAAPSWETEGKRLEDDESALLQLSGASRRLSVSEKTMRLWESFAVTFRGQKFVSLDAASHVLSTEQMAELASCHCLGMDWDRYKYQTGRPTTEPLCNCINEAAHYPCGRPVLGYEPKDSTIERIDRFDMDSKVDQARDFCGWTTFYTQRFLHRQPFSVARYNDGEWLAMELGARGAGAGMCPGNLDGLPCGRTFVKRLFDTLFKPSLLQSTWKAGEYHDVADFHKDFIYQSSWDFTRHDMMNSHFPSAHSSLLAASGNDVTGEGAWHFQQEFWLNDIIHGLVREHPADLTAWMLVLSDKKRFHLTGVGPQWLAHMEGRIPWDEFHTIKPGMKDEGEMLAVISDLEQKIGRELDAQHTIAGSLLEDEKNQERISKVFLISASMMSNVIIADLYDKAKAQGAFLIDIGSGFDPLMNAEGIRRRTGTEAQKLYKNPSESEVKRMDTLMGQIEDYYTANGMGLPYFLQTPLKDMSETSRLSLARASIQRWAH